MKWNCEKGKQALPKIIISKSLKTWVFGWKHPLSSPHSLFSHLHHSLTCHLVSLFPSYRTCQCLLSCVLFSSQKQREHILHRWNIMPPISRQISSIRQLVIEFAEWRGSGGVRFIYFYFLDVNRCMWLIFEPGMWMNGYIKKCYAFRSGDRNVEAVLYFDSHVDP